MYKMVDINSWLVEQELISMSEEIFEEENNFAEHHVENKQLKEENEKFKKEENEKL